MKQNYRVLAYVGGGIALILILFATCCTVVDSGEVGIRFHKWSLNEQDYGGVEGTCKGWVFYNPITTNVFTYPTFDPSTKSTPSILLLFSGSSWA